MKYSFSFYVPIVRQHYGPLDTRLVGSRTREDSVMSGQILGCYENRTLEHKIQALFLFFGSYIETKCLHATCSFVVLKLDFKRIYFLIHVINSFVPFVTQAVWNVFVTTKTSKFLDLRPTTPKHEMFYHFKSHLSM